MSYFSNAGLLLVEVVFGLAVLLLMLRMLLQLAGANFYNPICQFIYRVTNPVLMPLRRILRPLGRIDLAALLSAWLLECIKLALQGALAGVSLALLGVLLLGFAELLWLLLMIYFWLILIGVVISFVAPGGYNPVVPLVQQLTAPVLAPFRRLLPDLGGMDFSPLFALLAIGLARILIYQPLHDLGLALARGG